MKAHKVCAAVGAVAISLAICGCGGGSGGGDGGADTTTTLATTITTTTITTTTLSKVCSEEQGQCTQCLNHTCLGCNPDYEMEENSTVRGGRCVAKCINQDAPPKLGRPSNPFQYRGKAWPQMCIKATNAHIFAIGDWGGAGSPGATWPNPGKCVGADDGRRLLESNSTVSVEGNRNCCDADRWGQKYVARQMQQVATTSKPDYILNVGDNFYPGGINKACSNNANPGKDPTGQWSAQFDQVYGIHDDIKNLKWLSVLGNHDYGGYSWYNGWDQQIFETWEREEWVLPAQFWTQKVQYEDFSVDYFFLDSNVVDVWDKSPGHNICQHEESLTCWGVSLASCDKWFNDMWNDGIKMTQDGLGKSTAEWHVIVTHFPPPTILAHAAFKDMITKYGIDLVVTGHKHSQETGVDKATGVTWIITGGGGGVTADANPDFPGGHDQAYGFVDFAINRTTIEFYMHTWGGANGEIIVMGDPVVIKAKSKIKSTESVDSDDIDLVV